MSVTTEGPKLRQLGERKTQGVTVELLWDPEQDQVFVAIRGIGGTFVSTEVKKDLALDAFNHPYAYF